MTGKLTKAAIDRAKPKADDYFLWDGELKGFGIKIARGGRKSYVCKYRAGSGRAAPTRRMTVSPNLHLPFAIAVSEGCHSKKLL